MRYLDDYAVGAIERFGRYEVTREEAIAFASRYDPQAFHLDDAAAAANPVFGRLSASGWQTAAFGMAMLVRHRQESGDIGAVLAGVGIDELRWLRPVYPGDVLASEYEVLEVRPSASRPDRGTMRSRTVILNQDGTAVLRFVATELLRRRIA